MVEGILFWIAGIFAFLGALGILRFPDFYTRVHAATMLSVGGVSLALFGVALGGYGALYSLKSLVILAFLLLTAPTSNHALARSAYRTGVRAKMLAKNEMR